MTGKQRVEMKRKITAQREAKIKALMLEGFVGFYGLAMNTLWLVLVAIICAFIVELITRVAIRRIKKEAGFCR